MSSCNRTKEIPWRYLLLAAGAAAASVGYYRYSKGDDRKKTTAKMKHTTEVYDQTAEPSLVRHSEIVQDQMMDEFGTGKRSE
ncbi:hypothetical protein Q7C36_006317 [Tachysurus vachellii]|uniref:Uncharacterized protein n=1 Tax=Tachysurus vachellii TaxID=175792 RepID=A0AA88SXJ7_TACVA|nr:hypothetical protein Q7C36_006317 [Tachysurus vachellii]